jgi:protein phosphatase
MMARLLQMNDSLADAGQALIDAANDAGGKDNIALILVRVAGSATGAGRPWWRFGR